MKSYNGFTPAQRYRALAWFKAQRKPAPVRCDGCGQTRGVIDWHSEDYSEPYSLDHIGRYAVCYVCHMMIHCRYRNPDAWRAYVGLIQIGARFPAFTTRNFGQFCSRFLSGAVAEQVLDFDGRQEPTFIGELTV